MWKRHTIGIAAALALLGPQGAASAQPINVAGAGVIMPGCREALNESPRIPFDRGICVGMVRAMFFFGSKLDVCAPDGATVRQALTAIVRYIDERPERMREHFELLALEAMQQMWPCRR